ncbi:MAG: alpha/beta hydrolase [Pseudomonadales bacterium]|nr:alpha/beta hydrolase [Pseudomonadales bacterium]
MKLNILKMIFALLIAIQLTACHSKVVEEKSPREDHYQRITPSQTVVFIHGMYLTSQSWSGWETYFQDLGYATYSPDWPLHDLSVEELNNLHPDSQLGELQLESVLEYYREFITNLSEPPILIGHSMGGLITQLLLAEAEQTDSFAIAAGIAINSAPPFGVLSGKPKFLKANWPHLNPFLDVSQPTQLTFRQFQFGFVNGMPLEEQQQAYYDFVVPESKRIGRASLTPVTRINPSIARAPLLIIAGGNDNTIPASLNYFNFKKYRKTPAITDYRQFSERNHWTILQPGWVHVADYAAQWITINRHDL